MPRGAGAKYQYKEWQQPEKLTLLTGWKRDGLTDEQIAKNIGVSRFTLAKWKKDHKEIGEAIKKGREVCDYEVENAFVKSALGYFVREEEITETEDEATGKKITVKHIKKRWVPPNTANQIFYLKNRMPNKWREKQEITDERALNKLDEIISGIKARSAL